jgi:hypothetical protein
MIKLIAFILFVPINIIGIAFAIKYFFGINGVDLFSTTLVTCLAQGLAGLLYFMYCDINK